VCIGGGMFLGREYYLNKLDSLYQQKTGRIAVLYGRRRIGKSEIIHHFCIDKKTLYFEGLENESTKSQIENFTFKLAEQLNQPHLKNTHFESWTEVFSFLTQNVFNKKVKYILALDELQWLAAGQVKLVNQIKSYWDQYWKKQNVLLILCGSIAHFMVKKVINSKALYGRIDCEILVENLEPFETRQFLPKRHVNEVLLYSMVFGGVPKYFDLITPNKSFEQNINSLMFQAGGFFTNEIEKVFYSQFKEHKTYKIIVENLSKHNLSLSEISKAINYKSGGSLKSFLDNLELAGFVRFYISIDSNSQKTKKYKLTDEFLIFYFRFIQPHEKLIKNNKKLDLFSKLVKPAWNSWLGISFELFCLKNSELISEKLGFSEKVIKSGSVYSQKLGYQFDLVYYRSDKTISICEIKYNELPVDTEVIKQVNQKLLRFNTPRGFTVEKIIITKNGITKSLLNSEYFDQALEMSEIFHEK
jgi:AAA+ ATPase superfamily predicted ATPase